MAEIQKLSTRNCSFLWRKSRMEWLKEGDANSQFFHRCVQKRRKVNEILGLNVDGVLVGGVELIREEINRYFENQFQKGGGGRRMPVAWGDIPCSSLSESESNELIAPFSEEEIRRAVWDCDSYKSPGPDDVTFSFIKQFWEEVKLKFIGFLEEFHENGKLVRGLIVLLLC